MLMAMLPFQLLASSSPRPVLLQSLSMPLGSPQHLPMIQIKSESHALLLTLFPPHYHQTYKGTHSLNSAIQFYHVNAASLVKLLLYFTPLLNQHNSHASTIQFDDTQTVLRRTYLLYDIARANLSLRISYRKPAPQKAWQSGMNPITQRSTMPAAQNGNIAQPKTSTQKSAANVELANADKHAHDRLVFLMANFMVWSTFPAQLLTR